MLVFFSLENSTKLNRAFIAIKNNKKYHL